jgi:alcohol dehydrogenase
MVGFVTAPSVAWGPGAIEQLSGLGARRAAVVLDPAVAGLEGPRRVVEELERAGTGVARIADARPSTAVGEVRALAERLRASDPDWIVAVGGGTTLDATKAARWLLERPELALERAPVDAAIPDRPRTRLAAAPTTSGSGAEASWSVDLFGADGAPFELAHRTLVPDWAIVDPRLAAGLSVPAVVEGALESAALACEAYLSAWASPFSDALAFDALRTVVHRLPHARRWSDDVDAREALHYAATEAGLAQSNAQRGVAHALARSLVRPTGLAYGTLLAIVLPAVLDFDRPSARDRLEELAAALRSPEETAAVPVAERLRRLASSSGVPVDLAAAGVPPARVVEDRARIVAETLGSPAVLANPRVPSAGDLEELLATVTGAGGAGRSR